MQEPPIKKKPETTKGAEQKISTPASPAPAHEHGGPKGLEPTRYGDWEINGKCVDF